MSLNCGIWKGSGIKIHRFTSKLPRLKTLRDDLEKKLNIEGTSLNGSISNRLAHVSNISFAGLEGEELLRRVNKEIAVSSGSACTSILPKPSHVLAAMGLDSDLGRASIRFSLGKDTTYEEIDFASDYIKKVVLELKGN